mgnify:CR=1 FL=1
MPGHPPPSREAGQGTAGDASKGVGKGKQSIVGALDSECEGRVHTVQSAANNHYITQGADVYNGELTGETAVTVTSATGIANASGPKVMAFASKQQGMNVDDVANTLASNDYKEPQAVVSWNGDVTPKASEDVSVTLRSQQGGEGVGVALSTPWDTQRARIMDKSGVAPTLQSGAKDSGNITPAVTQNLTVRRLTPVECERLQGFPDGWTSEKMEVVLEGNEWKATGKVVKQADGPRYKAMGNAVTVNVAEWLGKRIGEIFL